MHATNLKSSNLSGRFVSKLQKSQTLELIDDNQVSKVIFPESNPHWIQVVLSFYIREANRLPSRDEVLVGAPSLTLEQVELFFQRAKYGPGKIFSVANLGGFSKSFLSKLFELIHSFSPLRVYILCDDLLDFQTTEQKEMSLIPSPQLCQELRRLRPKVEIRVHQTEKSGVGKTKFLVGMMQTADFLEFFRCTDFAYWTDYFAVRCGKGHFRLNCTLDTGHYLEELFSELLVFGFVFTGRNTLVLTEAKVELEVSSLSKLPFLNILPLFDENPNAYLKQFSSLNSYNVELKDTAEWEIERLTKDRTPGETEISLKLFSHLLSIQPERKIEIIEFADWWSGSVRSSTPWEEVKEKALFEIVTPNKGLTLYNELDWQNGFEAIFVKLFPNRSESSRFAYTHDNVAKLALIKVFLQASIPVLLRGETGCGKAQK